MFIYGVKDYKRLSTYFIGQHELAKRVYADFDKTSLYTDAYVECYTEEDDSFYLSFVLKKVELGIIIHEITHLMQHIRTRFFPNGIEREFEAYLTEWIFNEIYKILKDNKLIQ
jgi:hypothetical protein